MFCGWTEGEEEGTAAASALRQPDLRLLGSDTSSFFALYGLKPSVLWRVTYRIAFLSRVSAGIHRFLVRDGNSERGGRLWVS